MDGSTRPAKHRRAARKWRVAGFTAVTLVALAGALTVAVVGAGSSPAGATQKSQAGSPVHALSSDNTTALIYYDRNTYPMQYGTSFQFQPQVTCEGCGSPTGEMEVDLIKPNGDEIVLADKLPLHIPYGQGNRADWQNMADLPTAEHGGHQDFAAGTYQLKVKYHPDRGAYEYDEETHAFVINKRQVTRDDIRLSIDQTPVQPGASSTLRADFVGEHGQAVPTGSIQFEDLGAGPGGANLVLGTASLNYDASTGHQVAALPHTFTKYGHHLVQAVYSGDNNYTDATAPAINVPVVTPATVTLTVNPAHARAFQPVSITAKVTRPDGSFLNKGTVDITAGQASWPNQKLDVFTGTVTVSGPLAAVGEQAVTAHYSGDNDPETPIQPASATQTVTLDGVPTTTGLTLDHAHQWPNAAFTATATVAFTATDPNTPNPAGSVTFVVDGKDAATADLTVLGTGALGATWVSPTDLKVGDHPITARFNPAGSSAFLTSDSAEVTATVDPFTTVTTLKADHNKVQTSQAVTLTATVTSSDPAAGGTVTFSVDGKAAHTVDVGANGVATWKIGSLPVGTHHVTATYNGDERHASSTSSETALVVTTPATGHSGGPSSGPGTSQGDGRTPTGGGGGQPHSGGSTGGGGLASTGVATLSLLSLAIALLAGGAATVALGRRVRRQHG